MYPWSEAPLVGVQLSRAWSPPRRAGFVSSVVLLVGLLLGLAAPQGASAVASSKQVTAILQGSSQSGWVTDAQLKAEYDKWKVYPNVTAAVRSVSSNKDDAKLLAWETAGMKYFYTAVSSDYRFSGSMYAPAASPDAVMARSNNLGLYIHQLFTQLTADSSWSWQTGIGKTNWAQLDAWIMSAKAKGKKVVWNEPSGAWNAAKANATAMSYFNKWKDTVVVTYGTNFPDQVNSQAKPGAVAMASAITAPVGVSVQSFNFTEASPAQAVSRAGVKALAQAGIDAGATYVEFSGSQAEMQLTSQFILGSEDFLSAPATTTPPPPALPKATAPKSGAYTATLIGLSQMTRSDNGQKWSTEKDLRDEYNLWNAKPNVKPTFRSMTYSKNDSIMQGWEADGFKYFWTAGSSDFRNSNGNFYVSQADGVEVLRRTNSAGLYLHELASQYTKEGFDSCAAANGGGNCKWDWATGIQKIDWGRIDHWVSIAREQGKKIIWSEPSHGFVAMLNDASARSWFARWGDTLVPMWSTNFSNECRIAQSEQGPKCQVKHWSRPGAKELAAKYSGAVGDSVQSWFFRDQQVSSADPRPKDALTAANALALANDGKDHAATYFQVEGYGEGGDMNIGASPSWYMTGIRQFLDSLASATPPALSAIDAQRVPLYAWMNFAIGDMKLTRANYNDVNYTPEGIAGYVYDRQAPGSVPLYQLWSDISKDYMYTADFNEVTYNESSWLQYKNRTVIGYVMAEKYADTLPLYPLWNSNESMNDHRYTISPGIRDLFTRQQEFGYYQLQDVSAYLFDNDGRQITTPLTFMWSDQYTDSFYARDEDIPWYSQNGWTPQMRVGAIYTEPVNGAVPVYEMWSDVSTDHIYTTDPLELYRNMSDPYYKYKNVRVIGYAPRGATSAATWSMHQYWNSGTPQYPGWANHHYSPTQGSWAGYEYQGIAFWVVPVDNTAPPAVLGFDAAYDPEAQNTTVSWIPSQDAGFAYYKYSYSINGGAYSSWISTDINEFTITGATVGVHVGVKAVAVDSSGNQSSESYQDVVVQIPVGTLDAPGTDYAETPDADVTITPQPSTMINDNGQAFTDGPVATRSASTPKFDNMCPGDATTCGTFNGVAAGRYAVKYYRKAHANVAQFSNWEKEGGDCTNFVSQALWAGGKRFLGTEGYFTSPDGNGGRAAKMFGVKNSWFSNYVDRGGYRYYTVANAWYRVKAFRVHLEELNLATRITSTTALKRGDVVFINSDGNSLDGATHVEVVSQLTNKYGPWVASHSKYYNMPMSKLKTRLTNLYGAKGANDGWNWWVYRPTATGADLPS